MCDGADVIDRYGLRNEKASQQVEHAGIPHPTTIIIDKEGIIRFKKTWVDYRKRTSPKTIIEELDKLIEELDKLNE